MLESGLKRASGKMLLNTVQFILFLEYLLCESHNYVPQGKQNTVKCFFFFSLQGALITQLKIIQGRICQTSKERNFHCAAETLGWVITDWGRVRWLGPGKVSQRVLELSPEEG